MSTLPVVDLSHRDDEVAAGIGRACREHGFFYLVGHGIDEALGQRLAGLSHRFFALILVSVQDETNYGML